MLSSELTY